MQETKISMEDEKARGQEVGMKSRKRGLDYRRPGSAGPDAGMWPGYCLISLQKSPTIKQPLGTGALSGRAWRSLKPSSERGVPPLGLVRTLSPLLP